MAQNYPVYEVLHGVTLPALGATIEVYIVQQGQPTIAVPKLPTDYKWNAAPPDPNNLAVTQNSATIPGNVYAVGLGNGNGTYATSLAAQTAANAYCTSLATARDQAAAINQYKGGDATGALSNPTVEFGPL